MECDADWLHQFTNNFPIMKKTRKFIIKFFVQRGDWVKTQPGNKRRTKRSMFSKMWRGAEMSLFRNKGGWSGYLISPGILRVLSFLGADSYDASQLLRLNQLHRSLAPRLNEPFVPLVLFQVQRSPRYSRRAQVIQTRAQTATGPVAFRGRVQTTSTWNEKQLN